MDDDWSKHWLAYVVLMLVVMLLFGGCRRDVSFYSKPATGDSHAGKPGEESR